MPADYKLISSEILARQDAQAIKLIKAHPGAATHWKPIMDAAYVGAPAIVSALLKAGADPNVISGTGHKHTPLIRCLHRQATMPRTSEHTRVLELLLAAGADVDLLGGQHNLPPLAVACIGGFDTDIQILLAHGATRSLHSIAMMCDRPALKRRLSRTNADLPDHLGRSPLHYLAFSGMWKNANKLLKASLDCARLLLEAGAEVDRLDEQVGIEDDFRPTALWRAVGWQKHHALARLLLEASANPDNAIFAAAFEGDAEMLALLAEFNVNLEPRVAGRTPLLDLFYYKRPGNAQWLLAHGADVGATDSEGKTALHLAALQGVRPGVVEQLLEYGANRQAIDQAGNTPVDYARQKNRSKLIDLLAG